MFHFTIRDVLWLTLVVALALGWWGQHKAATQANARLQAVILQHDALVNALDRVDLTYSIMLGGGGKSSWGIERKDGSPINR